MSKKAAPGEAPADEKGAAAEPDEHHGMGGSYIADPKTGKRTLQERTANANAAKTEE